MGKQGPKSINIINKARMGSAMQDGVNPPMLKSQGVPMAPSSPAKIAPVIGVGIGIAARWALRKGAQQLMKRGAKKWLTSKGLKEGTKKMAGKIVSSSTNKVPRGKLGNVAKNWTAEGTGSTTWYGKGTKWLKDAFVTPGKSIGGAINKNIGPFGGINTKTLGSLADYAGYGYGGHKLASSFGSEAKDSGESNLPPGPYVAPDVSKDNNNTNNKPYVKPGGKATGKIADYASGSDARKAEYDARGWKYDDTIKGYDKKGNKLASDNRTAPKPSVNTNPFIDVNKKPVAKVETVKPASSTSSASSAPSTTPSSSPRKQIPFENPTNRKEIRVNKQYRKATGMDKKDIKTAKLEEKMNISGDGLGGRILSNRVINRYDRGMESQVNVSPDKKPVGIKQPVAKVNELKPKSVQPLATKPMSVDVSSLKPRGELQTTSQANKAQDELDLKGSPFKRKGCGPRGLGSQYK